VTRITPAKPENVVKNSNELYDIITL